MGEIITYLYMAVGGLGIGIVGWTVRGWIDRQHATRKPRLIAQITDDLAELEAILKPDPDDADAIGEAAKEAKQIADLKARVAALP